MDTGQWTGNGRIGGHGRLRGDMLTMRWRGARGVIGAAVMCLGLAACSPGASVPSPTAAPAAKPTTAPAAPTSAPAAPPVTAPAAKPTSAPAAAQPTAAAATQPATAASKPAAGGADENALMDALYQQAKDEGGPISCYCTLSSADKILPVFEKHFPGLKVEQVDGTQEQLAARALAEAKGGRQIGDVFQGGTITIPQLKDADLMEDWTPDNTATWKPGTKGSYWYGADAIYIEPVYNTNVVKDADAPKNYEDLADPKWKGKLIGEPRDVNLLMGLALYKYKNDEKAVDLLKKIAANEPEWHNGHSDLTQLIVAGQAAVCFTCYAHQQAAQVAKGAPIKPVLTEGEGDASALGVFKKAPHPMGAKLFATWVASEEGQKAYASAQRVPLRPGVAVPPNTVPNDVWFITPDDYKNSYDKYQKMWNDVFGLR